MGIWPSNGGLLPTLYDPKARPDCLAKIYLLSRVYTLLENRLGSPFGNEIQVGLPGKVKLSIRWWNPKRALSQVCYSVFIDYVVWLCNISELWFSYDDF